MITPSFETARLSLVPLNLDHAPATQALFPHWDIVKHLNPRVPWPYPEDGALTFYRDSALPAISRGEALIWALVSKSGPDHLIGTIRLNLHSNENRGFWLGLPWQGRGLMAEACVPVTDFWFEELDQPVLRVAKAIENTASVAISQRQGMRVVAREVRPYVCGELPTLVFELTRQEWQERRANRTI